MTSLQQPDTRTLLLSAPPQQPRTSALKPQPRHSGGTINRGRGFTLLDVLMSISVIGVLISITLPTLSKVRDTTHKVVCSVHIRELLLATEHWGRDNKDALPSSVFAPKLGDPNFGPQFMQTVRLEGVSPGWDGLGMLWSRDYGVSVASFYCPAHTGEHRMSRYLPAWVTSGTTEIISNYHLRAIRAGSAVMTRRDPRMAFVADGMGTRADFNHKVGTNVGRLDGSVTWFSDLSGTFAKNLPDSPIDAQARDQVETAWTSLDLPGALPVGPPN